MAGQEDLTIFDRAQVRQNRLRALPRLENHDFLFRWTATNLLERLSLIKRDFDVGGVLGARLPPFFVKALRQEYSIDPLVQTDLAPALAKRCRTFTHPVTADAEYLPFGKDSLDIVLSGLDLHTVNDLPGTLIQINHALRPDGLFLAALLGGESLFELRECLMKAELEISGGASPRVFPFADKQQCGALLQRAGFALPVVDSDLVKVTYPDLTRLMHDLRYMGEGNCISGRINTMTPPSLFQRSEEIYRDLYGTGKGQLEATFEVIFLIGWSPHTSQQQPMRPGSAKENLADALDTEEIATGIKPTE